MENEFEKKNPKEEEEEKEEEKNSTKEAPPAPPAKKEEEEDDSKKKKYNLEDVVEYAELQEKYASLQTEKAKLEEEVAELRQFKLSADRQAKQNMIDSFYMLSDEDKKDVKEHIDNYSLDDIEAKLSIICVRNKVNFNLEEKEEKPQGMFNLDGALSNVDDAPDWIKAVRATVNK